MPVYGGQITEYRRRPSTSGGPDAVDITVSDGDNDIAITVDALTLRHLAAYAENPENGRKISRPGG